MDGVLDDGNRVDPESPDALLQVIARLKPGVTTEAARRDIASVADCLAREHPDTNRGHGADLTSMRTALIGPDVRLTSIVLAARMLRSDG